MPDNLNERTDRYTDEAEIVRYFNTLKGIYGRQRNPLEGEWDEALRAYFNSDDMAKSYEGYANIRIPEIDKKVTAVVSRLESMIFNVTRLGRIEGLKMSPVDIDIIKLQNKYIFNHQLSEIGFRGEYHQFNLLQAIQGTAVAKITQEYEQRDLGDGFVATIKDNTYWRTVPLKTFYSDITKSDIRDSAACIYSTEVSMETLRVNEMRLIENQVEVTNPDGSTSIRVEETVVGNYFNLDLLSPDNITEEYRQYLNILGISEVGVGKINAEMQKTFNSGIVRIDECYGMYDLNGDGIPEEVLVTIANGCILIRAQSTPFKHNRYIRPFIVGRYKVRPNFLYGESNAIKSLPLVRELNATRSMITDSKNFSIFPMLYINVSSTIDWDGVWRPNGVIKGVGPNPISAIINPANPNLGLNDAAMIQRDIDEIWSVSPIQQGQSDRRLLPDTARQTNALIAQNEFPLDNIIINKVESEIKPFIEMLFERNMQFKDPMDILQILDEEEIKMIDVEQLKVLPMLIPFTKVKILGNMKLSQERANREGYERLLGLSQQIPNLARRLDYKELTNKLLGSYGILDDAEDVFIPEESVQAILKAEQEQKQVVNQLIGQMQQQQQQMQQVAEENQKMREFIQKQQQQIQQGDIEAHVVKKRIDLEADMAKMQIETDEKTKRRIAEAEIELRTGKKVN